MYDPADDQMNEDDVLAWLYSQDEFHCETNAWGGDCSVPTYQQWLIDLIQANGQMKALADELRFLDSDQLIQPEAFASEMVRLGPDPLLERLEVVFAILVNVFEYGETGQHYTPSPYAQRFLWAFRHCAYLHEAVFQAPPTMARETAEQTVFDLNARLGAWYQAVSQPDFVRQCNQAACNAKANHRSLHHLIDSLFACHSRLLVLRVDLSYSKEEGPWIAYETARHHREQLCRRFNRQALFNHLLGFAWKLEWRPRKGFHYHFLFFFDANRVRKDVPLARQIGELWAQQITGGQGIYHNCNHKAQSTYRYNALGEVCYHEAHKRRGLDYIVNYLTKVDEYATMAIQGRSFQTSPAPRLPEGSVAGRPRLRPNAF